MGNYEEEADSQYRMIRYYGVSAGQLGRLKKNMYVSTHTIEMLCDILECRVEDILEYRPGKPADKEKDSDDDRIFYSQTARQSEHCLAVCGKRTVHLCHSLRLFRIHHQHLQTVFNIRKTHIRVVIQRKNLHIRVPLL